MNISRAWATPLTIGTFGLMAITGILMFFHLDTGLNKTAHEWLGWLMVAGVAAHSVTNWNSMKRYFVNGKLSRGILLVSALVIAGSFVSLPGGKEAGEGKAPQMMALRGVIAAPVSAVSPLAGRSTGQLIADLAAQGIVIPDVTDSIQSVTAGDRELERKAIRVIFGK